MLTGWFGSPAAGNASSVDEGRHPGNESPGGSVSGDDVEIVEEDQGNVLSHLISQLRPGADLSRVVLPTFILEPRSMLERITKRGLSPSSSST
jgi:hypothetical protein